MSLNEFTNQWLLVLDTYINKKFDEWKIETKSDYSYCTYSDAYTIEEFTLRFSDYMKNQAYIELDYAYADRDNEYFNGASIAQHELIPEEYQDKEDEWILYCETQETETDKLMTQWRDLKPLKSSFLAETVTIETTNLIEWCYMNITHRHIYQGINIKARLNVRLENMLKELDNIFDIRHHLTSMAFNHYQGEIE